MKNTFNCLLLLFISNMSVSQEQTEKTILMGIKVFKFYPNPLQYKLFILGANKIKSINLINVLGKRVAFYHFISVL